jgi:hypothetical protein
MKGCAFCVLGLEFGNPAPNLNIPYQPRRVGFGGIAAFRLITCLFVGLFL